MRKNILGEIYPWDFNPGGSFSRDHLSEGQLCRGQIIPKAIFLGGNFHGDIVRAQTFLGNCPEAIIRGQLSRGQLFEGQFSSGEIINVRVKTNSKSLFVTGIISAKQGRVKLYSRNKKVTDKQKQKNDVFKWCYTKRKALLLKKTLIQNSKIKAELLWIKMEQSSLNFTKTQTFPKRSTASEWKNY